MAVVADADLDLLLSRLAGDPRLVHVERLPPRPARHGTLARPLPAGLLDRFGVERLWSHQAEAIDLVRDGTSVALATGTASGKSLCYQLPIAEAAVEGLRPATALAVFPTKALAQDQLRALTGASVPRLVAATYDGDCGQEERTWVRTHANVVLTNPEMLHAGLLPNHARWATFLMRLRYVVVDELHILRGIFGTNVAHLLRRLRRLCATYGSDPTFVFSSATIGRPERLASDLCGLDVVPVTHDGSPRGERLFVLWDPAAAPGDPPDPAVIDDVDDDDGDTPSDRALSGTRVVRRRPSANRETATLVAELVGQGRRTIAFCRSRRGTETVTRDVARRLPPYLRDAVRAYRAGYLAAERREIEAELLSGALKGVVATTALELGVDIGGLDACVLNGFPGTIASMWQQAGRAGRSGGRSIAVLVAGDDQLDRWLMAHPAEVFTRSPEPAVVNVANPFVLGPHLACAAYEQPLSRGDERWWPGLLDDAVRDLVLDDRLRIRWRGRASVREPIAVWGGGIPPAHRVGIRGNGSGELHIVLADGTLVGTTDRARACSTVHPGAVYLHQGQPYEVVELDLDEGLAIVRPVDGSTTTQPRSETEISVLETDERTPVGVATLSLGTVRVRSRVTGYRRFDVFTRELLAAEDLHLPPSELVTRAFWYVVPPEALDAAGIPVPAWPGALHAVEHAAIGMMPLFAICDRWDVGGVSTPLQADTGSPTIVIYDGHAGGSGVAELGYAAAGGHLRATLEVIESCPCDGGCPSCVQSPKCGNGNEPLDKDAAAALLRALL